MAVVDDDRGRSSRRSTVVHQDKIPWPTRGPNVAWTTGSTMRKRGDVTAKSACKRARLGALVGARG